MYGPPQDPVAAKQWVQAAMAAGRYLIARVHFPKRLTERKETMESVKAAIARAEKLEPYPAMPEHGGTCWRVTGMGLNGKRLAVGVELFLNDDEKWTVLCTVIDLAKKGRSQ